MEMAERNSSLRVVFVELLDEGTTAFRPVIAEDLGDGRVRLLELPEYGLLDEQWSIAPGSIARIVPTFTPSSQTEIDLAVAATD